MGRNLVVELEGGQEESLIQSFGPQTSLEKVWQAVRRCQQIIDLHKEHMYTHRHIHIPISQIVVTLFCLN